MPDDPNENVPTHYERRPANRLLRPHSYELPPTGPMHHRHRRHFADLEGTGLLWMLGVTAVIVYFLGREMGLWHALSG